MALSDLKCRSARPSEKTTKLSDGEGLQLWVQPTGAKLWRLAYRFGGKRKLLSLGTYPVMTLAEAREARLENKRLLAAGIDPADQRKRRKEEIAETFRLIAEEYMAKQKREGRAEATLTKTEWLLAFAYPVIGHRPISDIDAPEVLKVLRSVEMRGRYETANRLRSTIGSVFRFAIATARASTDPSLALRGAITMPIVTPRAAVTDPEAFGGLLRPSTGLTASQAPPWPCN